MGSRIGGVGGDLPTPGWSLYAALTYSLPSAETINVGLSHTEVNQTICLGGNNIISIII